MNPAYLLTALALDDLDSIWAYIARDSGDAAERVELAILDSCELLAQNPFLGANRSDVTSDPVRFWTLPRFPNYTIVYLPETHPLEVVAVLHGRRDFRRVLTERGHS